MSARQSESVWDYPRPPRIDPGNEAAEVWFGGQRVASTGSAVRVLETSHPPVYCFLPRDVRRELLEATAGSTVCEWKGPASYYELVVNGQRASPLVRANRISVGVRFVFGRILGPDRIDVSISSESFAGKSAEIVV